MQILSILLIGIALSMDTFSLSLSLGTFNITNKQALKLSIIVGIMHFFMPILGMLLGEKLISLFELQCDFLLGVILLFIAIQMIIDLIKHEENSFKLNILGMFLFALGVSLDSFSVGLGIKAITENINLATSIFAICSFIFTFTGIMIGKFANKFIGTYASIFGVVILLILGIVHIL